KRGFEFLGIALTNGAIRPNRGSRTRLLASLDAVVNKACGAFRKYARTGKTSPSDNLIRALRDVSGLVEGWGKHYSFCNEKNFCAQVDIEIDARIRTLLGCYKSEANRAGTKGRRLLLGVPLTEQLESEGFSWRTPKIPADQEPTSPSATGVYSASSVVGI